MALWLTSDWHLFDPHIIVQERRPFSSLEEMHETLVTRWNSRVDANDLALHLGDVTHMGFSSKPEQVAQVIGRLQGYKVLVCPRFMRC